MTQVLPIVQLTTVNDFATNVARNGQSHVTIYGELLIQQETVNSQLGLQVERPISVFTALVTTPDGQQAIASLTVVQGKPQQTLTAGLFPTRTQTPRSNLPSSSNVTRNCLKTSSAGFTPLTRFSALRPIAARSTRRLTCGVLPLIGARSQRLSSNHDLPDPRMRLPSSTKLPESSRQLAR